MGDSTCRCGCVPEGMLSLFKMAEMREKHKAEQKKFDLIVTERISNSGDGIVVLDLHGLELNQLFINAFITSSSNLIVLHLDHNNLVSIPHGLFSIIQNLRELSLHDNLLKEMPSDLSRLTDLQSLSLDRNQLIVLPDGIGECKNLTKLHLDGNHSLFSLPSSIGGLNRLHHILMNDVGVSALPYSMYQCVSLQLIAYDNTVILDPPPSVMNEGMDSIKKYLADKYFETSSK